MKWLGEVRNRDKSHIDNFSDNAGSFDNNTRQELAMPLEAIEGLLSALRYIDQKTQPFSSYY